VSRAPAVLFALGVLVSGATLLHGIQPNDEGLMLQAAARIAGGEVPYSDFWWFYPPGQAYLLGGLQELVGASLVPWRVVRVLADAGVAVLAFLLARRHTDDPRWAYAAWTGALLAMATPTGPHPFPLTLAACLGALLLLDRHPAWAGALVGVAAFWRLEFAAGLAVGGVLGLVLRDRVKAPRFALAAAATGLLLYAPVVLAAGLGPSWDLLVDYPLTDFSDYQRLPFPLDYDGPLNTSSVGGFLSDSAENLLVFYLPLVLVVGLAVGVAGLRGWDAPTIALAVFSLVMLQYLLVRADLFHTAPLAVVVCVLLARSRRLRWAAVAVLAYVVVEGADRRVRAITEGGTAIASPVADGVQAGPQNSAGLDGALRTVRRITRPGEPIYVMPRRADLVTAGHPLFYYLAQRPNPTRYDIQAPGVVTSEPVQREIAARLPRVVVRWTDPVTAAPEPNAAGRSTGVTLLDDVLAREYRERARHGPFVILERR